MRWIHVLYRRLAGALLIAATTVTSCAGPSGRGNDPATGPSDTAPAVSPSGAAPGTTQPPQVGTQSTSRPDGAPAVNPPAPPPPATPGSAPPAAQVPDAGRSSADVATATGSADTAQPPPPGPALALAFRAFVIDRPGGTAFGQTSLVDVDNDGDLDFVSGAKGGNVYWFEYRGPDAWTRHLIGGPVRSDVGGVAIDVDQDGWLDQVSGGDWYKNPGAPATAPFRKYATSIVSGHDNVAGDLDGDGRPEIVALSDNGVWIYRIARDATAAWSSQPLAGRESPVMHGGLAIGDLDGDGDNDIARVDRWYENTDGKGGRFVAHATFDFGQNGPFGIQTRALIVDLDRDGDRDLVQTEGDILNGRVAWFENKDGRGRTFERHIIRAAGHDQDFHSLVVADFDRDGDPDVFSCGGPLSKGTRRWLLWQNTDGKAGAFKEVEIHQGHECHEAVAGDVDKDGDIDLASKPWNGDTHVFLENVSRR